jgi:ubiquinone biosynthesis protein UbiJ
MSEDLTLPGFTKKVIDKSHSAQQTASSAVTTSQSIFHGLASLQPTMAEVAAVVLALELLHAVIEALHTAKTNVRAWVAHL